MRGAARAIAPITAVALLAAGCSYRYTPRSSRRVSLLMEEGQPAVFREGRVIKIGLFGNGLVDAVRGVPPAEDAARTFRDRMTTAWVFLGIALVGVGVLAYRAGDHIDDDEPFDGLDGAILGGVFVCEIGALVAALSGAPYMYDALNLYNDAVSP
jgi:hypothetical protein